jgi:hypothetical protein
MQRISYAAMAFGTTTDVSIAATMCWRLYKSRTGYQRYAFPARCVLASCSTASSTDSMLGTLMMYAMNTGILNAICVLGSLVGTIVAPNTQFELFFLLILPGRACCTSHRPCGAADRVRAQCT